MRRLLQYMAPYKWWVVAGVGHGGELSLRWSLRRADVQDAIDRYFVPAMQGTVERRKRGGGF